MRSFRQELSDAGPAEQSIGFEIILAIQLLCRARAREHGMSSNVVLKVFREIGGQNVLANEDIRCRGDSSLRSRISDPAMCPCPLGSPLLSLLSWLSPQRL